MSKLIRNNIVGGLAVIVSLILILSCSSDIVLKPLPSLLGNYDGHYSVIDNSSGTSQTKVDLKISWTFTEKQYRLDDTTGTICSPRGEYTLSGNVTLKQLSNGAVTTCDSTLNPIGVFSLRQPGDSVILTQEENNIFKEVRLKKINIE